MLNSSFPVSDPIQIFQLCSRFFCSYLRFDCLVAPVIYFGLQPTFWLLRQILVNPVTDYRLCSYSNATIFFKIFSLSFGVADVIFLLYQHIGLLRRSKFILDYFTSINNSHCLHYYYKSKKKRNKIELITVELISNILLLFIVTMTTYTFDATELRGVILCFHPHHEASVLVIHHTFNVLYCVDLYEIDFCPCHSSYLQRTLLR